MNKYAKISTSPKSVVFPGPRPMTMKTTLLITQTVLLAGVTLASEVLPSWNEGKTQQSITSFVAKTTGSGARFGLVVHHSDDQREWAYDRKSSISKLDKALDEAIAKGWTIVDLKNT